MQPIRFIALAVSAVVLVSFCGGCRRNPYSRGERKPQLGLKAVERRLAEFGYKKPTQPYFGDTGLARPKSYGDITVVKKEYWLGEPGGRRPSSIALYTWVGLSRFFAVSIVFSSRPEAAEHNRQAARFATAIAGRNPKHLRPGEEIELPFAGWRLLRREGDMGYWIYDSRVEGACAKESKSPNVRTPGETH